MSELSDKVAEWMPQGQAELFRAWVKELEDSVARAPVAGGAPEGRQGVAEIGGLRPLGKRLV